MPKPKPRTIDPVEEVIAQALEKKGVAFVRDFNGLDFFLPAHELYIECKRFHTARITDQMARVPNIIAIQGLDAAKVFAALITGGKDEEPNP